MFEIAISVILKRLETVTTLLQINVWIYSKTINNKVDGNFSIPLENISLSEIKERNNQFE